MDEWFGVICCPEGYTLRCADQPACKRPTATARYPPDFLMPLDECVSADGTRTIPAISSYNTNTTRRQQQRSATGRRWWHDAEDTGLGRSLGEQHCAPSELQQPSRCVVVGLSLPSNQLRGELGNGLCLLPHLQLLSITGNELDGTLPSGVPGCFSSLRSLDLSDNSFGGTIPKWLSALGSESAKLSYLNVNGLQLEYPEDKIERQRELQPLVAKCLQLSTKCEGLPPLSCDAFRTSEGDKYKPRTDSEGECVACRDIFGPITLLAGTFVLGIIIIIICVAIPPPGNVSSLTASWIESCVSQMSG